MCTVYHIAEEKHFGGKVKYVGKIGAELLVGPVAQWIRRLTTDQEIPGSNPGRFAAFIHVQVLVWSAYYENGWRIRVSIPVPLTC